MGEEQKVEEPKAEEVNVKPPVEEKKDEEPKPPPPFVLHMDLHCVGCAKKIERSLLRIPGVVGIDIDMEKNQVTIKGVVEPEAVCDKITKKTKRRAKVLSPLPAPIPQIVTSEVPGSVTVELNVNMHCEACALQLKRKILRMKGVTTVETDVNSSKVTVTGSMDGEKLVEYVYRRTKKQAKIVPQPEPAEKPKEEEKAEEKPAEEAKPEEKPAEEEKKEGGEGEEEKKEKIESVDQVMDMQRMMYYHQYPPLYVMERIPPPQLFSDENPNACSIC